MLKRGFKRAACQIKFTSDKGNKINTATVEEKVPLFEQSDDWELMFDVDYEQGKQRKNAPFPAHITTTDKRPDGVMFSDKLKTVMWLELTSPWEDNLTDAYTRKKAKYNALETQCRSAGWTVIPLTCEDGALGHINTTWGRMSNAIGMSNADRQRLTRNCSKIALLATYPLSHSPKRTASTTPPPLHL